jgi:hypothetical protein
MDLFSLKYYRTFKLHPSRRNVLHYEFFQIFWRLKPSNQCCGSGMFIPDLIFIHPGSRIQQQPQKRGRKKLVLPFFVATNITKNENYFIFELEKKRI